MQFNHLTFVHIIEILHDHTSCFFRKDNEISETNWNNKAVCDGATKSVILILIQKATNVCRLTVQHSNKPDSGWREQATQFYPWRKQNLNFRLRLCWLFKCLSLKPQCTLSPCERQPKKERNAPSLTLNNYVEDSPEKSLSSTTLLLTANFIIP